MQATTVTDPRPFRAALVLAVVLLLGLLGTAGVKSYQDLQAAHRQEAELSRRIATTEAEIQRLEGRVERLAEDPQALERLAREELWLARPDEIVIVLPEEPNAGGD